MPLNRLVLRAALHMRDIYLVRAANAVEQNLLHRLAGYQRALDAARAAIRDALSSGLSTRNLQVQRRLRGLVQIVRDAIDQTIRDPRPPSAAVPDLRTLLAELRQLQDDFESVEVDCRRKVVSATTESIVLAGVHLGPFAIRLCWTRLLSGATSHCFEIEALEPKPAAAKAEVTHPHVSYGELCPGEASLPLQRALEQGRLADAFCLVHRVLATYNPHSAHVPLDEWGGAECCRCGASVADDEGWHCDGCSQDVCSDCSSDCEECHGVYCRACLLECEQCERVYCENCLSVHVESCVEESESETETDSPAEPAVGDDSTKSKAGCEAGVTSNEPSHPEILHEPNEPGPVAV